ncbi:uncharacterized protein LOC144144205 isoform X1 [Haemaphysalis longicornis]
MHTVDLTSSQLAVLCCVVGSCECCVHRLFPGPAAVGLVARQGRLRACRLCAYVTTASSSMTTHLRTHTGERPYGCPFCPSAFAQSANLKRHVRTHTGERPFACFHCPSSFAQKSDLRSHLRLHTGERPYRQHGPRPQPRCPQCSCATPSPRNFKNHQRPSACSHCGRACVQKSNLVTHLRVHAALPLPLLPRQRAGGHRGRREGRTVHERQLMSLDLLVQAVSRCCWELSGSKGTRMLSTTPHQSLFPPFGQCTEEMSTSHSKRFAEHI